MPADRPQDGTVTRYRRLSAARDTTQAGWSRRPDVPDVAAGGTRPDVLDVAAGGTRPDVLDVAAGGTRPDVPDVAAGGTRRCARSCRRWDQAMC
jgi:hypothetical protein